jgi:hypothetical protein
VENTVTGRAMLSVRDTAIAAKKILPEFEQCSCSVPLFLSKNVLFMNDQVTDIQERQTKGVVVKFEGYSLRNTHG